MSAPMPPLIRVEVEGLKASLVHHLSTFGESWEEMVKTSVAGVDLQAVVNERVKQALGALVAEEVARQVRFIAAPLVEEVLGKDKYVKAIKRIESRVRREAQLRWDEEAER